MKTVIVRSVLVLGVLLSACGGPPEEASTEAQEQPTVFDPLLDARDRAAGVQNTLDEAAAERRRQLEEAER